MRICIEVQKDTYYIGLISHEISNNKSNHTANKTIPLINTEILTTLGFTLASYSPRRTRSATLGPRLADRDPSFARFTVSHVHTFRSECACRTQPALFHSMPSFEGSRRAVN